MGDFQDLPVETVAGERPRNAIGDRLLIGLAAVALLGGLLIAAANLVSGWLPESAAAPSVSPNPSATATVSRTPRPTPTERPLREISVIPGAPPEIDDPRVDQVSITYWIEAIESLPIHRSVDSDETVGRIAPGEVVLGERQPGMADTGSGWLYVYTPAPAGWVNILNRAGRPLANLYEADRPSFPSLVQALAGGSSGFVAHGSTPSRGYGPPDPITIFSADGVTWSETDIETTAWGGWAAAWGPSGWLAVHTVTDESFSGTTWLWESASGSSWTPVGELKFPSGGLVMQLVGSERGYLLGLASRSDGAVELWFSPDGLTWQESSEPAGLTLGGDVYGAEAVRLSATDAGFLAWRLGAQPPGDAAGVFSRDGRSWMRIELAEDRRATWLLLGLVGDSVVGTGRDDAGATLVFTAALEQPGSTLQLQRARHMDLAFDGAAVTSLVTNGATAYAFGHARDGGGDLAWSGDAGGWRRLGTPENGFGQPVLMAAAGPDGALVVGGVQNGVHTDPVMWRLLSDGSWSRQATEAFPPFPAPTQEDCGVPPDTAVEFMGIHPSLAVPCFGDRDLTFTAWSLDCQGCFGGGSGAGGPEWLINAPHPLALVPIEVPRNSIGWWREAILAEDVPWRGAYVGVWLRITGHYDDPASADCRWSPDAFEAMYYFAVETSVNACRQRFVITEVNVVDGPGGARP